ncbi:MAG: serine protease [Bacteriovoracaceae bacterium]|nr:serine protease [Bacteriovoracaceae bacterium]
MNTTKGICLLFLSLATLSLKSLAGDKRPTVIYGDDNRTEPFLFPNLGFQILARSVAAQIDPKELILKTDQEQNEGQNQGQNEEKNIKNFSLQSLKLKDTGICRMERFANQPTASQCSGFLVGKDILVTAGHCIKSQDDCKNFLWAFDYTTSSQDLNGENIQLKEKNIYRCKNIIASSQSKTFRDFAIVRLDRPVVDRMPLKLRTTTRSIGVSEKVLVIGHPSGLPQKISNGAVVTKLDQNIFYANLDSYSGNSGSPVFNELTGEVEGILVMGNNDYVSTLQFNEEGEIEFCGISHHLPANTRKSEGVSYISHVLPYLRSKF